MILRGVDAYGLPHALRITIGTEEANASSLPALNEFMAARATIDA